MEVKVLVSVDEFETRVAVLEESNLVEYIVERDAHRMMAGNIYKGRVCSIIPGMQAAFIDVGLGRNAFLFVSDAISPRWMNYPGMFESDEEDEFQDVSENTTENHDDELPSPSIEDLVKDGQEIIVQMDKEPIGGKGARVTANISLPGRYVVLLPNSVHLGVSKKIESEEECLRLRETGSEIMAENMGLIMRTAAEGASKDELKADLGLLIAQWERIQRIAADSRAPCLLHREMGIPQRILRDSVVSDSVEFIVDDKQAYDQLRDSAQELRPDLAPFFTLYEQRLPLFQHMGIEREIAKILDRKIWLNCGGYIVIDETEALTAVDVNTGKFVGNRDLEETVFRTNTEAVVEIARQVRLRNLSGIIIVDLIDMKIKERWGEVVEKLEQNLRRDRAHTRVLGITELGLLEMTRKRVYRSVNRALCQACPYCKKLGVVLSADTMAFKALRLLQTLSEKRTEKSLSLYVNPSVATRIEQEYAPFIENLEAATGKRLQVLPCQQIHIEEIREHPVLGTSESRTDLADKQI